MGITDPLEEYFKDSLWGYDGTQWRKLALLFGYTDRLSAYAREQKSGAGQYSKTMFTVPSGYVYVVQYASIVNETTVVGSTTLLANDGSSNLYLYSKTPTAAWELIHLAVGIVMKAGDYLAWIMNSCLDSDWIRTAAWGYKMAVS